MSLVIMTLQDEMDALQKTFDLQWEAQQRAIKRWQKATGKELVWPDTTDLIVWLMERLDSQQDALEAVRGQLILMPKSGSGYDYWRSRLYEALSLADEPKAEVNHE